jgi:glycosyltransferase involved in cell wall biosynthesis
LGLIEAMMTGVPTVSISKDHMWSGPELFEADEIALLSYKDPRQANQMLREILEDTGFANTLSGMTRERAIALFSAERIKDQWREFLGE